MADVTHLRLAYEKLARQLERDGRADWLADEMAVLTDPATYRLDPEESWRRLKPRTNNARTLMLLKGWPPGASARRSRATCPASAWSATRRSLEIASLGADHDRRSRAHPRPVARARRGRMGGADAGHRVARRWRFPNCEWPVPEAALRTAARLGSGGRSAQGAAETEMRRARCGAAPDRAHRPTSKRSPPTTRPTSRRCMAGGVRCSATTRCD